MPYWETKIYSYDPKTKDVSVFSGQPISAPTPKLAQSILNSTERGYMRVTGFRVLREFDSKTGVNTFDDKSFEFN